MDFIIIFGTFNKLSYDIINRFKKIKLYRHKYIYIFYVYNSAVQVYIVKEHNTIYLRKLTLNK